ncbi:MAG: mannose-1-phosphate guanylyltransferase/mannose-6-phosphate isomerase [Gammaproteobacteria bacterium]|nr:mannose-1-phosphate guanylyltransferase/mannose-6-phosphate isomerase [Gammaproteobacteria bacterium]
MLVPVILCGGAGTRLWPLSREQTPKPMLPLLGQHSLLQETLLRARAVWPDAGPAAIVCNLSQRFQVRSQADAVFPGSQLVLEPTGRNTAPAIAVAALLVAERSGPDTLMLVLPADHAIGDVEAFSRTLHEALPAASNGELVTFGVTPDRPETGYGYIRSSPGKGVQRVEQFVEKPDRATAEMYLASGRHYWNSGMFLFRAGTVLAELGEHAPDILSACRRAVAEGSRDGDTVTLDEPAFAACRAQSIDYAVMEKTVRAAVAPLDAAWSDIGSWAALHEASLRDAAGNAIKGDVMAIDCNGSLIRSESRLVAAIGLQDCVVVETADVVMVAPRERSQDVRRLVDDLNRAGRSEARAAREVQRPWGSFDSLVARTGFQVKRLCVLPGAVLSLQMHRQRAEHWIVVAGRARITCDDKVFDLGRGAHTYIPLGARHRIENPSTELLEIVEVQIGDYLGEDDIVRFEDRYGRQGRTD